MRFPAVRTPSDESSQLIHCYKSLEQKLDVGSVILVQDRVHLFGRGSDHLSLFLIYPSILDAHAGSGDLSGKKDRDGIAKGLAVTRVYTTLTMHNPDATCTYCYVDEQVGPRSFEHLVHIPCLPNCTPHHKI